MVNEDKQLITIDKLDWHYNKDQVLKDINLKINKNGFYGIIGPNGSGKTTLLKNITRTLTIKKGTIFFEDSDVKGFTNKDYAKKVSYVPQNTNFQFEFSVMDVVLMGRSPYLRRFHSETIIDNDIVKNVMDITNTWYLKDKNINMISGGERQRVIIARALAQQSNVIILDEPISQLDIHHQIEILEILKKLTEDQKLTVIMSLHDLNLAAQYCDHLILMDQGKVFKKGSPMEIINERNIQDVYKIKVCILENPHTGRPYVIPLRNYS